MKSFNRGWSLAAIAAAACFVAALGAGLNFMSFQAAGNLGPAENPDVDGVCKIKYETNNGSPLGPYSRLHLTITGLRPGVTYGVKMDGDGAGFSDPLAFTTNPAGHGSYQFDTPGQFAPNTFVQIYIWDGHDGELINPLDDPDTGARYSTIFDVTADELRANAVAN
jgi:hypothetical protein